MLTLNATERAGGTGDAAPDSLPPGIRPLQVLALESSMPGDGAVADTVTLVLDASVTADAAVEPGSSVDLFRANESGWTAVDPTNSTVTNTAYRFQAPVDPTDTVVLGERVSAIRVTAVTAANESVVMGTPVTVSANVSNRGLETGTRTVALRVGDDQMATRTVTLAPGKSQMVAFTHTFESPGTYDVAVGNQSMSVDAALDPSSGESGSPDPSADEEAADSVQQTTAAGTGASDPALAESSGGVADGSANRWPATMPFPVVLIVSLVLVLMLVVMAVAVIRLGG
jgi:hypothetical protein